MNEAQILKRKSALPAPGVLGELGFTTDEGGKGYSALVFGMVSVKQSDLESGSDEGIKDLLLLKLEALADSFADAFNEKRERVKEAYKTK